MELINKKINASTLEVAGVDAADYPKFTDAHIQYAEYEDGTKLTYIELETLTEKYSDKVNELAHEKLRP